MSRLALCLAILSLATACQTDLSRHTPAELDLDPIWSDFDTPLDATDTLPSQPDVVADRPAEIPTDPLEGVPPSGVAPVMPGTPPGPSTARGGTPGTPRPPTWDPARDRSVDRGVYERGEQPPVVPTTPDTPIVPDAPADPVTASGDPDGDVPDIDPFLVPSTPDTTDPSLAPAGDGTAIPGLPGGDSPAPIDPVPSLPDTPVEVPTSNPPTPVVPAGPPSTSDDLGVPPGGAPAAPIQPRTPQPKQPVVPAAPAGVENDPFAPPAGNTPAPVDPPSGMEHDPFAPGGRAPVPTVPKNPDPSAPVDDDVWSNAGGRPNAPSVPGVPDSPTPSLPDAPAMPDTSDPFADGGGNAPIAPAPYTFKSGIPEERAQEQAARLLDDPGNPAIQGFPREVLMITEAWVALREGPRSLAVVFYDDSLRTSDQLAAEVLPVLAAHQKHIDIVAIDRRPGADLDQYERAVVSRFLGSSDDVPVLVVQGPKRNTLLARFGPFPGDELDEVLRTGRAAPAAERPAVPVTPDTPSAPTFDDPRPTMPGPVDPNPRATQPSNPPRDDLPPTGAVQDPLGPPPTADPGASTRPSRPVPPIARDPIPPIDPAGAERDAPLFSAPKSQEARRHAARLRESPRNGNLGGYPAQLLRRARPELALAPGHRPVVIVFYDDASRASNLQAADILPVLVEAQNDVDIIAINVAKKAQRTEAEQKVVRPYYPGSLPATVVLSATRAPVKLWYQRISSRALRAAISQASKTR